jgi:phosphopantetheine--protein transferase-like protein
MLDIPRMARLIKNPAFMARVYSERENAYIASKGTGAAAAAAGIFCAKEALAKATGKGLLSLLRSGEEVLHDEGGKPRFARSAAALSITHTASLASAVVLMQNIPQNGE